MALRKKPKFLVYFVSLWLVILAVLERWEEGVVPL